MEIQSDEIKLPSDDLDHVADLLCVYDAEEVKTMLRLEDIEYMNTLRLPYYDRDRCRHHIHWSGIAD